MAAVRQNFVIEQGASWSQQLTWLQPDETPNDLTGFTARMQIRETAEAAPPYVELTTENGRITLGGVLGTIVLELDHETTEELPAGKWVYDLELVSAGDEVTKLIFGSVKVPRNVTREDPP